MKSDYAEFNMLNQQCMLQDMLPCVGIHSINILPCVELKLNNNYRVFDIL